MATQRPYAGSSAERLTALINKDNNSEIREGVDFYFGVPQAYNDTEGRNTQIVLTPIPGRPFNPVQKTVFYKRLELTALSRLPEGMVKTVRIEAVPFSIHEILGALNEALGVDLQPEEVEDQTFDTEESTYALSIAGESASLAWLQSTFEFKAVHGNEPVPLSDAIAVSMLNGLIYNPPG